MTKRLLIGVLAGLIGALTLVASGYSSGSKTGVTPLPSSSCKPIYYQGAGSAQYLIASDHPLQGSGRAQTIEMGKAIRFILKQHNFKAGAFAIGYQECDDSTAQAGSWDAAKCSSNARAYASDASVIGLIGTFNSGCAKIEIPIVNRAGLAMVSAANTYVGLTRKGNGTAAGEPGIYYPSGKRNYVRVVKADDWQGAADAVLSQQLGLKSVYILNDKQTYGLGVATNLRNALTKLGIKVAGFDAWDAKATSYEAIASKIKEAGADAVFLGGLICENGGKLIKDLRAGLGDAVTILAPDGFTPVTAVVDGAGTAAEGVFYSVAGLPNERLKGAGAKFVSAFGKAIGKAPDPYTVYAAQATEVLLAAIGASNGSRASVTASLIKTKITGGILGNFSITKDGDTDFGAVTIYRIKGGKGTTYKVITPPASLIASA